MNQPRPWHRLFGLSWIDFFQGTSVVVETEVDLSLKQQFLDLLIIRLNMTPLGRPLPDGFDNLAAYNLITFKSHQESLELWTLWELVSHFVTYRKIVSPSHDELLPASDFRLYAVCARFPQGLAQREKLTKIRDGVYEVLGFGLTIRVIVVSQLPQEEHNAMLHLFSAREELLGYGQAHFRPHSPETSTLLIKLFEAYGEETDMPDKLKEFARATIDELLARLPAEERMKGLPAEERLKGLPAEERLKGLPAEERLKGLPAEERLKGLPAEERLKGLPAAELLKGMSAKDVMSGLPAETLEALVKLVRANGSSPEAVRIGRRNRVVRQAVMVRFCAREELLGYGQAHFRPHSPETSTLLIKLFEAYGEETDMPDKLKESARATIDELLARLPAEERLKGLPAEELRKHLPVEERLKGMSAKDVMSGLPAETLEALVKLVRANGSSPKP